MRYKLFLFAIASILFSNCLLAQKTKRGVIPNRITCTFGDVKPEDFASSVYSIDSSAEAVYLFDGGTSVVTASKHYGWEVVRTVHRKIRILKKPAFDLATVRFRMYVTSDLQQELNDLKASTYNLSNGSVTATTLNKSDVFQEKQDSKFVTVKFTLPNVSEGSIIEYTYTVTTPNPNNLDGWEFQKEHPVLCSDYEIAYPTLFNYVVLKQGYQPYVIDTVTFTTGNYLYNQETGEGLGKTSESLTISTQTAHCIWAMKNVPALKEEPFTTTLNNHIAKVDFQLSRIQYSETDVVNFLQSWSGVSDTLIKEDYFLGKAYVIANGFLDDDIKNAISGVSDDLGRAKKIYEWVRNNYSTTENRAWLEQPLRKVYLSKKGNSAEVNSILLVMLKQAGLEAYPVLLSTTNHGKTTKDYPLLDQYNYTVCDVKIDDKDYLLDAANNKLGFNHLSAECYNGYARVINPADPEPINLSADSLKERNITSVFIINDKDNNMSASISTAKTYEESLSLRNMVSRDGKENFFNSLKKSYSDNIQVKNVDIDSLQSLDIPVTVHYDLQLDNNNEDIIYFNPILAEQEKENPFSAAERYYPVEMPYCTDKSYVLNMDIPTGYTVDELPKSARVKLNEDEGMFEYLIAKSGDKIQFRTRLKLEKAIYDPEDYQTLREFYAFVVKKEAEQIVFKKIK